MPLDSCEKGSLQTLYYSTGSPSSPIWVEHEGVIEDLDMNETDDLPELSARRDDRLVKEYGEGETELSITGTQVSDTNYEGWVLMNSARPGGEPKDFLCLTNKISVVGAYGWRGHMWNSDRTGRGPGSGSRTTSFNLQPSAACLVDHIPMRIVMVNVEDTIADFDPTE